MKPPKRKKRVKINWKQIAIDLNESAGCGCCSNAEERYKAVKRFEEAVKLTEARKAGGV